MSSWQSAEVITAIQSALAELSPQYINIDDDSRAHATHAGAREGGHFTITIVADIFVGLNRVKRQRIINQKLEHLFANGIHALVIVAKTPEEFYH